MTRGAFREAGKVRCAGAWWLALSVLLVPTRTRASELAVDEFSAPPAGCPAQATLKARVAQLTEQGAGPSHARVAITRTASGYHTDVTLISQGEARQRSFDTETCEAGVEAAAIALALGSQPITAPVTSDGSAAPAAPAAAAAPAAPPAPVAPARVAPPVPVTTPTAPQSAPPNSNAAAPVAIRVSAAIGFDGFALPSVAPTAELGVSLAWRECYWLEARALGALPQDVAVPNGQAHFMLFGAALRGCYLVQSGSVAVGPCLGFSAFRLFGEGKIAQSRSGSQFYGGPSGAALVRWKMTRRLALRAGLEGLIAVSRQTFLIDGTPVYTPGKADFSGTLGADFRF